MEGLFIIIAVAIAIINLSQKQKQNQRKSQGSMRRRPSTMGQNPAQQWMKNLQQPDRTVRDMENRWEEGSNSAAKNSLESMFSEYTEGNEIEDRSGTGSLGVIEQSQSSEGICNEHPEHAQRKKKDLKAASKIVATEREEDNMFDLTKESLLRSIIMAEVLGPPRAMKRRIR